MLTFEIFSNKITEINTKPWNSTYPFFYSITIPFAQNRAATKLYIVRHAEKMTDNPKKRSFINLKERQERKH
jgi:hypothetical protein